MKSDLTLNTGHFLRRWSPHLMLIVTLVLTAVAATYVAMMADTQDRFRFQSSALQASTRIQNRLEIYISMLRSGSAMVSAGGPAGYQRFRSFVDHIGLRENYPGVQGIGYTMRLPPESKDSLERAIRAEWMDTFRIWPATPRDEYHATIYLEPLDLRNHAAIGYDMFTDATRRRAMERARDSGVAAATGKVTLVQEIDAQKQQGFLIYYPVYGGDTIPSTVAERRRTLVGYIYSPFRADDLLKGIFEREGEPRVDFRVFDGTVVAPQALLHTSKRRGANEERSYRPRFTLPVVIYVAGHPWTILFSSRPELELASSSWLVPYILIGGVAVSLLIFWLSRAQSNARRAAERSARRLHRSEERYRTIVETAPDVIYMISAEGTITSLSPAFERLSGWKIEEWIGRPFVPLVHPGDLPAALERFQMILVGETPDTYELRILGADGNYRVVEFRSKPYYDGGAIVGSIGIARDVTERKRDEVALRTSESRLRLLVESSLIGIILTDSSGSIIEGNEAFLKMAGYSRGDLEQGNLTMTALTSEEYHPLDEDAKRELRASGGHVPFEKEIIRKDGSRVPILVGTALLGGPDELEVGYILDLTDRKRAEESIRTSEERYRAFVENSSEAIWRFELEQPIATDAPEEEQIERFYRHAYLAECNDAMARMYGFEHASEIEGARLGDLLIRSDPDNVAYLRAFIRAGYHLIDAESIEVDREGHLKHFSNNLVGIVEEGRLVRAWGTQRDITARRMAEMEIRKAKETAEAASRAKDQFLAVLSHELRTPLTPVLTAIQLMNEEPSLPADLRSLLHVVQRNVELEARLIDDLLDLTRIANGKLQLHLEIVDIHALVRAAIEISDEEKQGKGQRLDVELNAAWHHVLGDPARLQQVFWNLVKNAIKFTPADGSITIRSYNEGSSLRVEVVDTGIGIEPHILPRIFNAFEQGEKTITRRFGGLGLGLAISKMLVELHGGTITARSEGAGRGAIFAVDLETAKPTASTIPAEERSPVADALRRHSILLVDDHGDTIAVLKSLLERHGYNVVTASNVQSALEAASAEAIDLLVSDIGLPDGTGHDIMRELRRTKGIPGIALSGFGMEEDVRRSVDAGFTEHIAKPVNFKVLHEVVKRLLG